MRHQDQLEQARKLLAYLDTQTTAMADAVYRNEVTDYTCPKQLARECELFFKGGPLHIGLSCLLPSAGDYMTHDYSGVPILLVRQDDGSLRAFLNVCRHRGARVAEGCGQGVRRLSCPYHAWSYATDGRLLARPDERSFAEVDKSERGLRDLAVVEKYGMIWLSPTPGAHFDLDARLAGLEGDLAAYRLDTYHLRVLHAKTVDPILYSNLATFDGFGRNLRMIGARRTIDKLRQTPEAEWNLIPYAAVIYVLFPNTVFVAQGDHIESWHVFPDRNSTDDSVMYVSLYTPEKASADNARRHWDRNMDLLMATVEKEDFPLSEGIQRGFYSGAQDEVLFGRNEPSLQHFHKSVKAALSEGAGVG